jgi:hypothetical protein
MSFVWTGRMGLPSLITYGLLLIPDSLENRLVQFTILSKTRSLTNRSHNFNEKYLGFYPALSVNPSSRW